MQVTSGYGRRVAPQHPTGELGRGYVARRSALGRATRLVHASAEGPARSRVPRYPVEGSEFEANLDRIRSAEIEGGDRREIEEGRSERRSTESWPILARLVRRPGLATRLGRFLKPLNYIA